VQEGKMALYSSALYDCAVECALRRMNRRCKKKSGAYDCDDCKYNIYRYTDADQRDVELFMVEAEMSAGAIQATGSGHHMVFIILISLCLLLAWVTYKGDKERESHTVNSVANTILPKQVSSAQHEIIMNTLRQVSRDHDRKVDVNKDGEINCIDAAVLFYKYYPDKDNVCIELNVNPSAKMNHLFNCVRINRVWKAIEPQSGFTNQHSYYMKDVWGARYDNSKNKDVTNDYLRYVK